MLPVSLEMGKKVATIEKSRVGGTRLNWGGAPTKTLVAGARAVRPRVRTYLASWGDVDVHVNDEMIYDRSERGFYSPGDPGNSSIASPHTRALHFVAHTTKPDSGNFPPRADDAESGTPERRSQDPH